MLYKIISAALAKLRSNVVMPAFRRPSSADKYAAKPPRYVRSMLWCSRVWAAPFSTQELLTLGLPAYVLKGSDHLQGVEADTRS